MFRRQSGVALVITLILLSVITFLAITFLAVARREKGSVTTSTEQKVATFAAESGVNHATAIINAAILASTNAFNFDLLISTNYENVIGFDPAAQPQVSPNVTNVNYDHTISGGALTGNQPLQNLANLMFSPRPPVVITNRLYGSNEFRFYVDLNRDGVFTRTGLLIVTNQNGWFYTTNGGVVPPAMPPPVNTLSNWFNGDPQFIGQLERPELPHSSSNKFVARYAFIVLPAGKTLDVNYIGNHAKPNAAMAEGYFRNMGVGSWENNFAAFLRDLNTNAWQTYAYRTGLTVASTGVAFDDARAFALYRSGGNRNALLPGASVPALFGAAGVTAMSRDFYDGFTAGPLLTDYRGWNFQLPPSPQDPDAARTTPATHWPGAYNPFQFYTSQDLFNPAKAAQYAGAGFSFVDRLFQAQTNSLSSYDRSTFYRMAAQLGTDSAPDPDDKINANYVNVGGLKSTNFVSWNDPDLRDGNASRGIPAFGRPGSEVFFVNAVDRLLRRYSAEWAARNLTDYTNTFGMYRVQGGNIVPETFSVTNIPVLVNGRFAYTPAVHRLLQVAANTWDATHPRILPGSTTNAMPTVFRPQFHTVGNDVYITNFVEQEEFEPLIELARGPLDLGFTNAVAQVRYDSLIYGVPLVIGARKGLPNFNEFASESVVQITRKIELRKSSPGGGSRINETNQMFIIGISNALGAEFWNSYASNYSRPVDVAVVYRGMIELTNDYNYSLRLSSNMTAQLFLSGNQWLGWNSELSTDQSLLVPMRTNQIVVPDSTWSQASRTFRPLTDRFEKTPTSPPLPLPRWGLTITNRVVAYILDRGSRRLLDYVQLSSMTGYRDITGEMATEARVQGFAGLWGTNIIGGYVSGAPGVIQQIEISKGNPEGSSTEWQSFGLNLPGGATRALEIAKFTAFMSPNQQGSFPDPDTGISYNATSTNLVAVAPFSPTWKQSLPMLWQANDPLIHYTSGDMEFLERSLVPQQWVPASKTNVPTMGNLGKVNERYRPWGGNPFQTGGGSSTEGDENAYNLVVKDPGVRSSRDWEFPTNKLATLGWLGRVHRGSPWQTIYLKAPVVTNALGWQRWSGNRNVYDAENTRPETDRTLFDVFTTALNENATRGQLPINQTNLAAWSAVFSGMVALTNSSTLDDLQNGIRRYDPWIIDPAGVYDPLSANTYPAVARIVAGINRERSRTNLVNNAFVHTNGTFNRLGDILAVPELTTASPFLSGGAADEWTGRNDSLESLNDVVMEWLPQQMMSLVKLGEPRFVVYAYGQGLKPADQSVVVSGPYFGMVTNYQITAEVVMRAVVRLEGAPDNPRAVVESYNVLGPE